MRSRGLLPRVREVRMDGPHLHPHLGTPSHRRGLLPHQSLRPALRGDHRIEPDRGRLRRQRRAGRPSLQRRRPCDPQRRAHEAPRRQLGAAFAYPGGHGGVVHERRTVAADPAGDAVRRPDLVPRVRPSGGGLGGMREACRGPREQQRRHPAQPRAAHLRADRRRGVHPALQPSRTPARYRPTCSAPGSRRSCRGPRRSPSSRRPTPRPATPARWSGMRWCDPWNAAILPFGPETPAWIDHAGTISRRTPGARRHTASSR